MLEAISALSQVILFSLIYLTALAAIASRCHHPSTVPSWSAVMNDYPEAANIDYQAATEAIRIDSPAAAFRHVAPRIAGSPVEHLILLLLNRENYLVGEIMCTDAADGYVRLPQVERIVTHCQENSIDRVIVTHNHPRGTTYPSLEDVHYTHGLTARLELRGVSLTDHLIITAAGYHSIVRPRQNSAYIPN
ncbi:MAG: JAB domain-containing protein [Negativicutes bacterium]|nr:JAB domain-containing protein [Negativicutes bacterium]